MKKALRLFISLLIWVTACQPAQPLALTATSVSPTTTLIPTFLPTSTQTPAPTPTATPIPTSTPETFAPPLVVDRDWLVTGTDVPALASFDQTLKTYMQKHGISSGALAVTYKGRLVMAHGYTYRDANFTTQPVAVLCKISERIGFIVFFLITRFCQPTLEPAPSHLPIQI